MHTRANKQKSTQNLNITNSFEVAMVTYPQVAVISDVIGPFYVGLFFNLELMLVMIRVGAKFTLRI